MNVILKKRNKGYTVPVLDLNKNLADIHNQFHQDKCIIRRGKYRNKQTNFLKKCFFVMIEKVMYIWR